MSSRDTEHPRNSTSVGRRQRGWNRRVGLCLLPGVALLLAACGFEQPAMPAITNERPTQFDIPPIKGKTMTADMMAVDQVSHRLWLSDLIDQGIDVFDISGAQVRYLRTIKPSGNDAGALPLGLVVAADQHRLYAGLDDRSVLVIDIDPASKTDNQILATVDISVPGAKGVADLIDYDPKDHKVFVSDPDDGYIREIDATSNTAGRVIDSLGLVGQPRYDAANGMLYVGSSDANQIIKIDPVHFTLVSKATIGVACSPHGLAIDPRTSQGVVGCQDREDPHALTWDFTSDTMLDQFDLSGSGDAVVYDAKVNQFFFAANNYVPSEMSIFSGSPQISYLTSVPTSHKSKMVGYDEAHDRIITVDGLVREAGLWSFQNPTVGSH